MQTVYDIELVPGQLTDCRRRRHQTTEDLDRSQSSQHDEVAFGDRGDIAPQQVNRKTPPGHTGAVLRALSSDSLVHISE